MVLKKQLTALGNLLSALSLDIEGAEATVESGLRRLDDLKKSKATAQSDNRLAINEADCVAAKAAQTAIRAANLAIEAAKIDVKTIGLSEAFERRLDDIRQKALPLPEKTLDLVEAAKILDLQARRLLADCTGTDSKIRKLTSL